MRPLILTGAPAVGKTTCGRALAVERDRAAYIDVDDIRQLIVAELGRNR
jgi:shikimate kinase